MIEGIGHELHKRDEYGKGETRPGQKQQPERPGLYRLAQLQPGMSGVLPSFLGNRTAGWVVVKQ